MTARRVAVLAEDLIWATRLVSLARATGAESKHTKTAVEFERELACADAAIVDLTARNYDAIEAIERAAQRGLRVTSVGQHEDLAARRRAFAAGATHVWTYNQLHTHGPTLVGRWLAHG